MSAVHDIEITHPDRMVYPEVGLSKLDVARYLERVAPVMLPHVARRPLVLVRCPEGLAGGCFFQKHWTGRLPSTLETIPIKQANGATRHYVIVDDVGGLVTLVQWGIMEIHLWGARADNLEAPDRIVFDLDPGEGVSWEAVRACGRAVRETLERAGLKSWVKTSGGKGLHIVVPIQRRTSWNESGKFAKAVADVVAGQDPAHYITEAAIAPRPGKVYLDWLRNARGASFIAPWSMRARPDAGVSVPITWKELEKIPSANAMTIPSIGRASRLADAWKDMSTVRQALTRDVWSRLERSAAAPRKDGAPIRPSAR